MKVIGNRVLVEPVTEKEIHKITLDGGNKELFIPGGLTGKDSPMLLCRVLQCGPGSYTSDGKLLPIDVQVGELILSPRSATVRFRHGRREFGIVREFDIYMIFEEKDLKDLSD